MSQIKVFGLRQRLEPIKRELSDVIHRCVVDALAFPQDKRAHRFFPLEREDFFYPDGRSDAYTIIEISMIEGRTVATKKRLVGMLFERINDQLAIAPTDLEICILESPAYNWGFRGMHGDEVQLNYEIKI
ncbi:MAG: tautomerase family protein [Caldilineaceae bacterium]|nr:tautomerase family protein [Caldilineaceae bacterium]